MFPGATLLRLPVCAGSGLWPPSQILETLGDHKPRDFEIKSCSCQQRDNSWRGGLEPTTSDPHIFSPLHPQLGGKLWASAKLREQPTIGPDESWMERAMDGTLDCLGPGLQRGWPSRGRMSSDSQGLECMWGREKRQGIKYINIGRAMHPAFPTFLIPFS